MKLAKNILPTLCPTTIQDDGFCLQIKYLICCFHILCKDKKNESQLSSFPKRSLSFIPRLNSWRLKMPQTKNTRYIWKQLLDTALPWAADLEKHPVTYSKFTRQPKTYTERYQWEGSSKSTKIRNKSTRIPSTVTNKLITYYHKTL